MNMNPSKFVLLCCISVAIGQNPCKRNRSDIFQYSPRQPGPRQNIGLIGSIRDVMNGVAHKEISGMEWEVGEWRRYGKQPLTNQHGFGFATSGDDTSLTGLGDAIAVNGDIFFKSTNKKSKRYSETLRANKFRSTFAVLILTGECRKLYL